MSEVTATPCECGSTGALLVAIVQYGAHHPQMPHQSFVLVPASLLRSHSQASLYSAHRAYKTLYHP